MNTSDQVNTIKADAIGLGLGIVCMVIYSCRTSQPTEVPCALAPPSAQALSCSGAPAYRSLIPAELSLSLPTGPNGESHFPAPQAVISVDDTMGRLLYLFDYGVGQPAPDVVLSASLEETGSALWSYKQNFSSSMVDSGHSGLITTWILPSANTSVANLLTITDQRSSINTGEPVDIVVWNDGQGAHLYSSSQRSSLLQDIYTEYAIDGYPILIVNGSTLWSCSLTGSFDASLIPAQTLTSDEIVCASVDERYARVHVRVGICVLPSTKWGAVLESVNARIDRVSELALLLNCGDNIDGTLDLAVKNRRRQLP